MLINTKLQEKSCYYLLINYMKKHHRKSRQTQFWKLAHAICNLHLCFNFALLLHENALIISQSEVRNCSCTLLALIQEKFKQSISWCQMQRSLKTGIEWHDQTGVIFWAILIRHLVHYQRSSKLDVSLDNSTSMFLPHPSGLPPVIGRQPAWLVHLHEIIQLPPQLHQCPQIHQGC